MKESSPLAKHQALCDDLYRLALDENRFLKESGRSPGPELAARKRELLARLDESLAALRGATAPLGDEDRKMAELTKARVLQFLHLDRENEQLLLRGSLARPAAASTAPAATARQLLETYARGR
jgi:hypothetical protein